MKSSPDAGSPVLEVLRRYRAHIEAELDLLDELVKAVSTEQHASDSRFARSEFPERMSMARAARYLGIGKQRLYQLIDEGQIPGLAGHRANQRVVVRRTDLDAYLLRLPPRQRAAAENTSMGDESQSTDD